MKNNNLILVGGGGHCKSVIEIAENAGFNIIGILDSDKDNGESIFDYQVLGTDDLIPKFTKNALFIVSVGQIKDSSVRVKLFNTISDHNGQFATIIANSSLISKHSHIGVGTTIMHHVTINSNVEIGKNCILNTKSVIEHDTIIGDNTHISTGAIINGNCIIGNNCYIGSGAIISNNVKIPDFTIIGTGSLVLKTISESGTYYGIPAIKH